MKATLYKITHTPSKLIYYGSIWAQGKTIQDRLDEHLTGRGSKFIFKLINDGASPHEFFIEQIAVGDIDTICSEESKLAANNLWPIGLNGNAGKNIIRTKKGQQKVSSAVSKSKKGQSKETNSGVAAQAMKLSKMVGEKRSPAQKTWDANKSEYNRAINKRPPKLPIGSKKMTNGVKNIFVQPEDIESKLDEGWKIGSCNSAWNKGRKIPNMKPRAIVDCPHCNKSGNISQMKRWHFDNCKHK